MFTDLEKVAFELLNYLFFASGSPSHEGLRYMQLDLSPPSQPMSAASLIDLRPKALRYVHCLPEVA
jgi:hypothetical protein